MNKRNEMERKGKGRVKKCGRRKKGEREARNSGRELRTGRERPMKQLKGREA